MVDQLQNQSTLKYDWKLYNLKKCIIRLMKTAIQNTFLIYKNAEDGTSLSLPLCYFADIDRSKAKKNDK